MSVVEYGKSTNDISFRARKPEQVSRAFSFFLFLSVSVIDGSASAHFIARVLNNIVRVG